MEPTRPQPAAFSGDGFPNRLPARGELRPAFNLSSLFDACHNYIYANEGLLKDKIFHEIVKLIALKLYDERTAGRRVQFGITSKEYRELLAGSCPSFEPRLHGLFTALRKDYAGFFSEELRLKPLTLAHVVGRLQTISLTQTPGDSKGEAFQAFVYRHQRGDRGEFFTPHPIVRLAVEMVAPAPHETVIDPACGSGGFLFETIAYVCRELGVDREAYVRQCIRGIEFNPDVSLACAIRLAFEGGTGAEVRCTNALTDAQQEGAFDIVLTNPPFGSKGKVEDRRVLERFILARRWSRRDGTSWEPSTALLPGQSPEILFIEQCLRLLKPGGRMAIVLPDGILQNISNGHVRQWIRSQANVLAVVSIPQEAFVPYGTGIKTSLLVLQRLPADTRPSCFMARVRRIGYDVKGQPVFRRNGKGEVVQGQGEDLLEEDVGEVAQAYSLFARGTPAPDTNDAFQVATGALNSRLDVEHYLPEDRKLVEHLVQTGSRPLGELVDILEGADQFRLVADQEIRYIAISDVDCRTLRVVSQQVMKAHEAPSRASFRLQKGDIITAVSGASTGTARQATALIGAEEAGAICSNGFAVLRNCRQVDPLFLAAYLRTDLFLRQVRSRMTGHAIPAISADDLARVLVPLPDAECQAAIARQVCENQQVLREACSKLDEAVRSTSELLWPPARARPLVKKTRASARS